jgi:hypothetical protein
LAEWTTRISEYFARSQEVDGSWYFPPLEVARPPLFESREEVALPTQSAALPLFAEVRPRRPSKEIQPEMDRLMERRNGDGG